MGRPKLLLAWEGTSIVGHLLRQWRPLAGDDVFVVVAEGDQGMLAELDRLGFPQANRIGNPAPERGMFSSVQCAARRMQREKQLSHGVIVLGDQPHLRSETLSGLAEFARRHPDKVCQPSWQGRPRHPVLLPRSVFEALAASPAATLKEALSRQNVALCPMADPGLDLDLDTPADYERALEFCRRSK